METVPSDDSPKNARHGSGAPPEKIRQSTIERVIERVDQAISRNTLIENIFIGVLLALFIVGLVLTVIGIAIAKWECIVPGALFECAVIWPITQLRNLRDSNIRLQVIPSLIAMADTDDQKTLVFNLLQKLINQV